MATFKGLGVFWGVDGITFAGFSGSPTGQLQSAEINTTADEKLIRDGDGDVIACVYYNNTRTLDLEVIPTGATAGDAVDSADNYLVASGTVITVTDSRSVETDTVAGGGAAGEYVLRESSITRSNEGEARISMSLYRSDINDLTDAVAAS